MASAHPAFISFVILPDPTDQDLEKIGVASLSRGEEVLGGRCPNRAMGELHDRMPVILAEKDWPQWLGEEPVSEQDLQELLKPVFHESHPPFNNKPQ